MGKTFKGLTDDEFRAMTTRLQALKVEDNGFTLTVRPEVVVEVAYNEIQRSPPRVAVTGVRAHAGKQGGGPNAPSLPAASLASTEPVRGSPRPGTGSCAR